LINSTFSKLSPSAFLAQAQTIVTAMTGNPDFPEPWSSTVPTLAQIQADLTAFQNAVTATAARDQTRIVERRATGATLANDLSQLGFYVQGVANGNLEKLATTGFPLRQRPVRSQALDAPAAPTGVRVNGGMVSGSLVIRSSRVDGAGSYDVQLTSADPTVEGNWTGPRPAAIRTAVVSRSRVWRRSRPGRCGCGLWALQGRVPGRRR
jgi:hypothetical protein